MIDTGLKGKIVLVTGCNNLYGIGAATAKAFAAEGARVFLHYFRSDIRHPVDQFPMSSITAEKHDQHFAVNSRAVALMMAEYARRQVERGTDWGRIVNVSTDGASGFSSEVSYGASKHAQESYSRAAAKELGKYGITVNVVSLGPIQTGWITPEMEKAIAARTPLNRVGQPSDVAEVIVFLASEQAKWLTGQVLYVGGGWQMPL